jgi:hypothetical protein
MDLKLVALVVSMGGAVIYALRMVSSLLSSVLGQHLDRVERTFDTRAGELVAAMSQQVAVSRVQAEAIDRLADDVGEMKRAMVARHTAITPVRGVRRT